MTLLLVKGLSAQSLKMPDIPEELKAPIERANYLTVHYWDNFRFADTSLRHRPEAIEQAFVDFLEVLPYASRTAGETGILNTLNRSLQEDSLLFAMFTGLYEKYLYEPESPMYNEEMYIPVLRYICNSTGIGPLDKVRPRYQLDLALKNRKDSIATDFTYTLANGDEKKLSSIETEFTLLFFNDPDCELCQKIKEELIRSSFFCDSLQESLTILSVYPGEEEEVWRREQYPHHWENGYDARQVIRRQELYDLKNLPVLYLLNRNKKIILKNTSVQAAEEFFQSFLE